MGWFDIAILAVIALSTLISLIRGFVKESISLASWGAAGFIALAYHQVLSGILAPYITFSIPFLEPAQVALIAAILILFLSTLIIGAIVNYMVGQLVSKTGLSGTDKLLGVIFGVARGVLIVSLVVLFAGMTEIPAQAWWKDSFLVEHFIGIALWIRNFMPADLASMISF